MDEALGYVKHDYSDKSTDNIRKIIYTTNVIEKLNSQFRKVTKTKLIFPTDDSLLKMLYLAVERIAKKWTRNYPGWDLVINQLNIVLAMF